MASNSIGNLFKLSTFGESHGVAIGGVLDGCPAGLELDLEKVQGQLDRRRPGQNHISTQRKESDIIQILSGLFEGKTTGASIAFIIMNDDQRSKDYDHLKENFRPSHADFSFQEKYGIRDHRGGGRSSARVTASIVAGGAIAAQLLERMGVSILTWVSRVHDIEMTDSKDWNMDQIESNLVRCPDSAIAEQMIHRIEQVKKEGDTVGGAISCVARGVPAGWGDPVFEKLHASLAKAMMGINAVKGFEIGSGVQGTYRKGSEENDFFIKTEKGIGTQSNRSGGIQGGISNGEEIYFNVSFKPVATIMQDQESVDADGNASIVKGKGRHDPCVVPRAVPIVEALCALVLADASLMARSSRL